MTLTVPFLTVGEAIRWASSFLHDSRMKAVHRKLPADEMDRSIRQEVETLLCWATGWSRIRLLTSLAEVLPGDESSSFYEAIQRRGTGQPVQYITGSADFYGRSFAVRPGCLIPRPETEVLAEAAIDWIKRNRQDAFVLDIGTGSGILALTIALEASRSTVWAVDLSEDALQIARENGTNHEADIRWIYGDGLTWLRQGPKTPAQGWNVVVSNPPYIPTLDVTQLDAEVRDWEPHLALDGGADGLDIYRRMSEAGQGVYAQGPASLFLEVGAGQAEDVRDLFMKTSAHLWSGWAFNITPDLRGIQRVVWGERR